MTAPVIRLGNVWAEVAAEGAALRVIREALTYRPKGYMFVSSYRNGFWDGTICLLHRNKLFPAGLVEHVTDALSTAGIQVVVADERSAPQSHPDLYLGVPHVRLKDYQEAAVTAACEAGRGVVAHAVGSGKTIVLLEIVRRLEVRALALVHRKDLLYQLRDRGRELFDMSPSLVGDGHWEEGPALTVATFQTLYRRLSGYDRDETREWLRGFEAVHVDETHHVSAETYEAVMEELPNAYYRFGYCLAQDTEITLADGTTRPIQEVKPGDCVLAFDTDSTVHSAPIRAVWANGTTPDCLCIRFRSGRTVRATADHLFLETSANQHRTRQWVAARALKSGHHLLQLIPLIQGTPQLNRNEVLLGSIAGDGHIARAGWFSEEHGEKQAEYARWKASILGASVHTNTRKTPFSPRQQTFTRFRLPRATIGGDTLRTRYYPNGKRCLTAVVRDFRTWQAIAIWIMDDGCWTGGKRNVIDLSLGNITEDDAKSLACLLRQRWGLVPHLAQAGSSVRYWRFYFNSEDTQRIVENCAAFVPSCMRYKFGGGTNQVYALVRDTVESVESTIDLPTYDLSVAGPPTFFANGIGVHNSATPFRSGDRETFLRVVGWTGPVIHQLGSEGGIQAGRLVPAEVFIVDPVPGRAPIDLDYQLAYESGITGHQERNALIARLASTLRKSGPVLILVERLEHGQALSAELGVPFLSGEASGQERVKKWDDIRQGRLDCIVASVIADEGLDLPNIETLILAGAGKAAHRQIQRIGRGLRKVPGKDSLTVFDFADRGHYLGRQYRARRRAYDREPAYTLAEVTPDELGEWLEGGD